jgi:hypothetical protein
LYENIVRTTGTHLECSQSGRWNLNIREHHQGPGLLVFELLGATPFLPDPARRRRYQWQ